VKNQNRYRFIIQANVCLVRICSGGIWAAAGPLLPFIMAAYDINRGTAGWFASIGPLAIVILSIPLGIFGTRYSLKKTFAVGAFLQAAGLLTPLCGDYIPLLATRACYALGAGITFPLIPAIAAEWFSPREIPLINGIAIAFNSLGNAMVFLITVPIATALTWQAPLTIYGGFALFTAISWMIFGKDRKKEKVEPKEGRPAMPVKRPELSIRQVLTQRSTIILTLATMCCWGLGNSVGAWLPTYYHQVFNMPLAKASSITATITIVGTFACLAGGFLPLRFGRRKPFLIIPGALMGISALAAVLFNNTVIIYFSIACFGVLSSLHSPSVFTIPFELPDMSSRNAAIMAYALQFGGNTGSVIFPLLVGYLADLTGSYLPGFIISAVLSLALLAAGLILPETGPLARKISR
jgi:cyanate permease